MPSTTLATYRTRIGGKLGLDSSTENSLIDGWLNDGYEDFLRRTRCTISKATMTLSSGVADYTLDTGILAIVSVTVASSTQTWPLEPASLEEILELRTSSVSTSQPTRLYATMGYNAIAVWPTPSAADTMTVYYVPRPTALSLTSDAPTQIPYEYHKALEFYALAEGADYDNQGSAPGGSQYYLTRYMEMVRECVRGKHNHGSRRLSPAVVRSPVSRYGLKNDTYPRG